MKGDKPYFSVIVPVYNVEKYIGECIDSILKQTFKNYELILIDDGATDSSGEICDQYAKKDERVRVFHKENGGLSSARNYGVDKAIGEYIFFVDSDDYIDDNTAFQGLFDIGNETNADILMYGEKKYFEEDQSFETQKMDFDISKINGVEKFDAEYYMLKYNIYKADAGNKIVKRKIIFENEMKFKDGYLSEDMDWCGDLLIYANSFAYYKSTFYVYRLQRVGSITTTNSDKLIKDKIYMCSKGIKQAKELKNEKLSRLLASYYAYEYAVCLGVSYSIKDKQILRNIKELSNILENDIVLKVQKINKVKRLLGYGLTRILLGIFVKLKN